MNTYKQAKFFINRVTTLGGRANFLADYAAIHRFDGRIRCIIKCLTNNGLDRRYIGDITNTIKAHIYDGDILFRVSPEGEISILLITDGGGDFLPIEHKAYEEEDNEDNGDF